jgi:hypothetical protein
LGEGHAHDYPEGNALDRGDLGRRAAHHPPDLPHVPPLQLGALGVHWLLWRHWTHRHPLSPPVAQYGVAPEQSVLVAQATQRFCAHAGVELPAQSARLTHCTHCCEAGSQRLCDVGQSADELQPTQAPVLVLQIRALPSWEHCWLLVHAEWHVWVPGQQLGVVPLPQSVLVLH